MPGVTSSARPTQARDRLRRASLSHAPHLTSAAVGRGRRTARRSVEWTHGASIEAVERPVTAAASRSRRIRRGSARPSRRSPGGSVEAPLRAVARNQGDVDGSVVPESCRAARILRIRAQALRHRLRDCRTAAWRDALCMDAIVCADARETFARDETRASGQGRARYRIEVTCSSRRSLGLTTGIRPRRRPTRQHPCRCFCLAGARPELVSRTPSFRDRAKQQSAARGYRH